MTKIYDNHLDLGGNIRKALGRKGMNQQELAHILDVHKSHVNKWCRGRVKPSSMYLEKIADALGCTIEELLSGDFGVKSNARINELNKSLIELELDAINQLLEKLAKSEERDEQEFFIDTIMTKTKALLNK